MLGEKTIAVIGAGNMAEAIISGLINTNAVYPGSIIASDKNKERLSYMAEKYGIKTSGSNYGAVKNSDIVILAVKPQNLNELKDDFDLKVGKLIISILAGTPTSKLERVLGEINARIVRVMPNTPAIVGKGMSAITGGKNATADDIEITKFIFDKLGEVIVVPEPMFDLVTGVSGSGPAYVFYFAQALRDAAIQFGMEPDQAYLLARQTIYGSAELMSASTDSPEELRRKVTSKGGTTERGVAVLEEYNLGDIILKTVEAAMMRSRELSSDNG